MQWKLPQMNQMPSHPNESAEIVTDHTDLEQLHKDMIGWRHHLHRHPEFGFEEHSTAAFVLARLQAFGITDMRTNIGGTGIVATLRAGNGNKSIAFRADMDALKITEISDLAYKSENPGVMHACGHDGHTTIMLGVAKYLSENQNFDGTVHLIFQPAEEWGQGMQAMIDDGLGSEIEFEEVYGLHNMPGIPVGHFATRTGAAMGAEDNFEITIRGSGGHSSRPHEMKDALVAACSLVTELQTVVSRTIDPAEFAVVSVTELTSDGTRNAIAGTAVLSGDVRSFDTAVSRRVEAAIFRLADGIANAHGCLSDVTYDRVFVPLINDAELTKSAAKAACAVAKKADNVDENTPRIGGSEDFARLTQTVPGNFMFIGNGDTAQLHNPSYDFNDDALIWGLQYFTRLAADRLPVSKN